MLNTNSNLPVAAEQLITASPGCVATSLDGETIILNVDAGVYYGLSDVGAFVWEGLAQPTTLATIQQAVLNEFAVDEATCAADLQALLGALIEHGLVTVQPVTAGAGGG